MTHSDNRNVLARAMTRVARYLRDMRKSVFRTSRKAGSGGTNRSFRSHATVRPRKFKAITEALTKGLHMDLYRAQYIV